MTRSEARRLKLARDLAEVHRMADAVLARAKRPPKRVAGPTRKEAKAAKLKEKRERTAIVRATCVERSRGHCEACGIVPRVLVLDHFWGRAREESVESCWMLCRKCNLDKTENRPDRLYWLTLFSMHAKYFGYGEQVAKCERAIALERAQRGRTT